MLGLAFFAMTASLLLVAYRRDAQRAFWIGFAAFGWVYLILLMFGWSVEKNSPVKASSLLTDRLSRASYEWLYTRSTAVGGYGSGMDGGYGGSAGGYSFPADSGMGGGGMEGGYGSSMSGGPWRLRCGFWRNGDGPAPAFVAPPSKTDFANVAHGIWAILLAACGGWLARLIYVTQPRSSAATST